MKTTTPDFLTSRLDYLRRLPDIGSNWLSQGSGTTGRAPETHVAELAASLLEALHAQGVQFDAHNLILGPLIAGGVSIEMKLPGVTVLQLELANDGTAEYTYIAGSHRVEGYESARASIQKFAALLLSHAPLREDAPTAPKNPCQLALPDLPQTLTDAELEQHTGEPHIAGYPLYSGLPPPAVAQCLDTGAPLAVDERG